VNTVADKTTCGPLFSMCLNKFTDMTDKEVRIFAAGHLTGQAEKVYLGACRAAMVRPSEDYRQWCLTVAIHLSSIYGLEISVFEREEIKDEIWIHRPDARSQVQLLGCPDIEVNSRFWHMIRGDLCGVPPGHIDHQFHERKGYGEVCDK